MDKARHKGYILYEISRVGKAIETENRLVVVSGWGKGKWTVTANGYGTYFRGDKNVLEYNGKFYSADGCTTLCIC